MEPITILLSDDPPVTRQGLRFLLETAEDFQVVGEAENGQQSVAEAQRLRPNVVVMDLAMPVLNGVEATRLITTAVPSVKVLILSTYTDDQHLQQAIQAGAAGYVIKETAGDDLSTAIREVHKGNAFFSPLISTARWEQQPECDFGSQTTNPDGLTMPQMEILQLMAEGQTIIQTNGTHYASK